MYYHNSKNLNFIYIKNFYSEKDSSFLHNNLVKEVQWKTDTIKIFGKKHNLPRLTGFHADHGITYSYSGIKMYPNSWTPNLLKIKNKIENLSKKSFNSVLLNRYRNGQDYHGYHSDNESSLGDEINIASVSFGSERDFKFKSKNTNEIISLTLENGSLLLMNHPTQIFWLHSLPKRLKIKSERINLTFRLIKNL